MIWFVYGAAAVAVIAVCLVLAGCFMKGEFLVGTDIKNDDITDFYCVYSSSTNPPLYYQYRFYVEDGEYKLFFEKREGDHFPLTEADATALKNLDLNGEQWSALLDSVRDGTVVKREESTDSGASGPWYSLYWNGDKSKYRRFSFASFEKENQFKKLCGELITEGD